ncbi:hypothetical protein WJX84_007990 [Apatococcus fuscideae]|uniref:Lipoyl-binding domain-containing protein n=1 Tax=Apatococcus fuscideae TaxID=2026836 RepID=A0AAW1RNJ6_9CHLO
MGDSISEGTIAAVLKQQGDAVSEDETILQIDTDKVTIDVRAPKTGKVEAVLVSADDTVSVGQHVATVAAGEEGASASGSGADAESSTKPQQELGDQQDSQLEEGMSQPGSHPGPQGGGKKQQKRQEGLEKEKSREEAAEKTEASSGQAAGPSHRQPSIRFPIRRTTDGRRLSDMPAEEAEQYRMQAQGGEAGSKASAPQQQQQQGQPAQPSAPDQKPAEDAAARQRHMLWYQGKERGSKLSQSSVLSQREMDMIELGGAY